MTSSLLCFELVALDSTAPIGSSEKPSTARRQPSTVVTVVGERRIDNGADSEASMMISAARCSELSLAMGLGDGHPLGCDAVTPPPRMP